LRIVFYHINFPIPIKPSPTIPSILKIIIIKKYYFKKWSDCAIARTAEKGFDIFLRSNFAGSYPITHLPYFYFSFIFLHGGPYAEVAEAGCTFSLCPSATSTGNFILNPQTNPKPKFDR